MHPQASPYGGASSSSLRIKIWCRKWRKFGIWGDRRWIELEHDAEYIGARLWLAQHQQLDRGIPRLEYQPILSKVRDSVALLQSWVLSRNWWVYRNARTDDGQKSAQKKQKQWILPKYFWVYGLHIYTHPKGAWPHLRTFTVNPRTLHELLEIRLSRRKIELLGWSKVPRWCGETCRLWTDKKVWQNSLSFALFSRIGAGRIFGLNRSLHFCTNEPRTTSVHGNFDGFRHFRPRFI